MDDLETFAEDGSWEAGFEADRRIVLTQIGPFKRVYPCPRRHGKRFFQRVYELPIEDWAIPLETPYLGPLCTSSAELSIRFQPTLRFARDHLDRLGDLGDHVRATFRVLLEDAAEQELKALETPDWLDHGHSRVEGRIENIVHELLALRDIQSRARCRIEIRFADPDGADDLAAAADSRHHPVVVGLLRRRREAAERLAREQYEREILERRIRLEHEERLLELLRREAELLRAKQAQETEQVRIGLAADETRYTEEIESEIRLREERIRQESRLRQMELEADLQEKNLRAEALDDVETHLRREIELLAMERQRLALEEEVHDVKVARARGWVINARRRFPLGEDPNANKSLEAEIAHEPPGKS